MRPPAFDSEVPQPEIQVWGGQRWLLSQDEDEVLCAVQGKNQDDSPMYIFDGSFDEVGGVCCMGGARTGFCPHWSAVVGSNHHSAFF